MKRLSLLLFLSVATVAMFVAGARAAEPDVKGKVRVLLTVGGHDFQAKPFFAMFDSMPGIAYTKAVMPKEADLLKPGLEKDYDVIVMYDMASGFTPEQQTAFVKLFKTGIGVVSLHHNLVAHPDWDEFRKIIGGKYITKDCEIDGKKYGKSDYAHDQDMNIIVADTEHPITRGMKDFQIHDETYSKFYVAPDVKVLLKTDHPKSNPDVAWVTRYGRSRVFFLMLGHDSKAWENPSYVEILARGIRWAAEKPRQ